MASAAGARPQISVIIPSYNAAAHIGNCLTALRRQQTSVAFEVIVVDSGRDASAQIVRTRFPEVTLLHYDSRRYAGHARNGGIAAARGDILAFTDCDCIPAPDWIEAVHRAHERPHPVIGGVIENGNPASLVGRAYYFAEFNHWLPSTPAGFVDDIAGCCWSMKRPVYRRYGPFIEGTYCSDTAFHWRLAADGLRPYLDPSIRVAHVNPIDWTECLTHESFHGRCFARVRSREQRLSRARLAAHLMLSPALPLVLFARAARRISRNRAQGRAFAVASPLVMLAMARWSWGEAGGYLEALRRNPSAAEG